LLREGASAVIAGPPNAGKSSLLNALLGRPRAIVSAEPGTTRDFLEERFLAGPYSILITDTAGLRPASADSTQSQAMEPVEREGIARALEKIATADFLLLVIDSSLEPPILPKSVLDVIRPQNTLVLENKTDLSSSGSRISFLPHCKHVRLSIKTGDGLKALKTKLVRALEKSYAVPNEDLILTSARQVEALSRADTALKAGLEKLKNRAPAELLASDLHQVLEALGEIIGRVDNEAMLDRLFNTFCIGK
jgi:tRNA modification GTPase